MIELLQNVFTHPMVVLAIGVAVVLGMILVLRVNAFLALISAAIVVSVLAPGTLDDPRPVHTRIASVAAAFGMMAGQLGIPIAMAAIIGKCLMDSGAADRIVRAFLWLLGERQAPAAMASSGFVLAIPVFFDTVFYLLVPLARSLYRRTGSNYMLYLCAIATGGVITHALVPPTPGPLLMAESFGIDLAELFLMGIALGIPIACVGLVASHMINRRMPIAMRPYGTAEEESQPVEDQDLPPLWLSLAPILVPVAMIAADRVVQALAAAEETRLGEPGAWQRWAEVTANVGYPAFALFVAAAIAMATLAWHRRLSFAELSRKTEAALMSGGVIILITAAGGAFGAMLREAQVGDYIEEFVRGDHVHEVPLDSGGEDAGAPAPVPHADGADVGEATAPAAPPTARGGLLVLCFAAATAMGIRVSQGSATVAMLTAAGIFAPVAHLAGCHPGYLAIVIGNAATVGSWMNDSGFWIFARMGVLTEAETIRSWTVLLTTIGLTGIVLTLLAAWLVPHPF